MLSINLQQRNLITRIARRYGASNIRVFGSIARGESTSASDIDLLVDLAPGKSLFDLGGLQYELEQALGIPVDVVTGNGLDSDFRQRIEKDTVPL